MFDSAILNQANALLDLCKARGLMLATAESCTGGWVAALLTEIAGSSAVMERGFVTYSNAAKQELLGVSAETLARNGAVSEAVAAAMARGALDRSPAHLAVAITGVAGPGGGTAEKPVGLVHFAVAERRGGVWTEHNIFSDDRAAVRRASVQHALSMLENAAAQAP